MGRIDYTVIVGLDARHLEQLKLVWPTWKRHKLGTVGTVPMIAFYDKDQLDSSDIYQAIDHPNLKLVPWPPKDITYAGDNSDKWSNPQRHKMLAGFVYVPALYVKTPYFLKIDTDALATGVPDWIDTDWFNDQPAIITSPWGFTRPPDQMLVLDAWIERSTGIIKCTRNDMIQSIQNTEPLRLVPEPGAGRVMHSRIISQCGFFNTKFNRSVAELSNATCGHYQLPVASQDGVLWYLSKRINKKIVRVRMKNFGWEMWSAFSNIKRRAAEIMKD